MSNKVPIEIKLHEHVTVFICLNTAADSSRTQVLKVLFQMYSWFSAISKQETPNNARKKSSKKILVHMLKGENAAASHPRSSLPASIAKRCTDILD